jgi:His Kinase A (phospho-acceptor) domain
MNQSDDERKSQPDRCRQTEALTAEAELGMKAAQLLDTQRALVNIVEDLNEKTIELEQANVKLQELDRLKSMFIASMSHEFRTPLNSIIGFSRILHDEWLGSVNAEQKENLAIIRKSGLHLLNLVNDVIDVSKIEAGKLECLAETFELGNLVEEAVHLVKKELIEKGLGLSDVHGPAKASAVRVEPPDQCIEIYGKGQRDHRDANRNADRYHAAGRCRRDPRKGYRHWHPGRRPWETVPSLRPSFFAIAGIRPRNGARALSHPKARHRGSERRHFSNQRI